MGHRGLMGCLCRPGTLLLWLIPAAAELLTPMPPSASSPRECRFCVLTPRPEFPCNHSVFYPIT